MIKKYCDRCGEVIYETPTRFPDLEFKYQSSIYDKEVKIGDICPRCRRKIIDFIELKREFFKEVNEL